MAPFYRKDVFDKLTPAPPRTSDELLKLGRSNTDPKSNRWAFGDIWLEVSRMFGVPQDFRVDSGGNLTYYIETPEFESAVGFAAQLYKEG